MALIRGHHAFDDQYTQIPNAWLRDPRLGLATKGLLAQIMSHRPGWSITLENLATANGVGRDAIRSCINQLILVGYLTRSEERERNSMGQVAGYSYVTRDPDSTTSDSPTLGEPTQGEPTLDKLLHKKNILLEEQVKEQQVKTYVDLESDFNEFWAAYPQKESKPKAKVYYAKALKRADAETILAGAIRYANDPNRDPAYTKNPGTWLNGDCWNDPLKPSRAPVNKKQAQQDAARAAFLAATSQPNLEITTNPDWA